MDKISWKDTKVLVTGADGFIGSHVAKALIEKGAEVTTVVRDIKSKNNLDILGIRSMINLVYGDLADFKDCERAIN